MDYFGSTAILRLLPERIQHDGLHSQQYAQLLGDARLTSFVTTTTTTTTMRPVSRITTLLCIVYTYAVNCFRFQAIVAFEICSDDDDDDSNNNKGGHDGICPNGNTCCRLPDNRWGCIASDMGSEDATCCQDEDDNDDGLTGCPTGYTCRSTTRRPLDCLANNDTNSMADPLTQVLPRYRLCHAPEIKTVHGLPVNHSSMINSSTYAEIPYYSNMGALERIPSNVSSHVDMALIVIHGATRNGDDYFCAAKATVELQNRYSHVLVIALNYYSVSDDDRPRDSILYWDVKDHDGSWRYGADSSGPVHYSSFAVLDQVVKHVQQQFPNLQRLTVAGHSAGGQLTQRWALLSNVPKAVVSYPIQTVVANPSNYAYLSPHRYLDGAWTVPSATDCPEYNQWEWGLQDGGNSHVPYRDRALAGNVTAILERYKIRSVYYLVGGLDRCNVSEHAQSGWCHSHGLETTCMDQLQGHNRYERSLRYVMSLRRLGYFDKHQHMVIPGVGHDHSMMFQSSHGMHAIYYGELNSQTTSLN